jgi:Tfp pilus assembly protein PilX
MIAKRKLICDKTGMVLLSSLLVVSVLMAAGMGAWIAIQNDYKITTNLRQATVVFYLADAGIEWAKQQINQAAIHPPRPADRVQSFSSGTFSVVYLSSTPVTPLTAKIVIRSTEHRVFLCRQSKRKSLRSMTLLMVRSHSGERKRVSV